MGAVVAVVLDSIEPPHETGVARTSGLEENLRESKLTTAVDNVFSEFGEIEIP